MAEGGEGAPVELKIRDRDRLQGLAQNVVLEGRRRGARALDAVDQRRLEGAQRLARTGKWSEALQELEGDGREIGRNLRNKIEKFGLGRNPDGSKNRTPAEQTRYTNAMNALNGLIPILETEGFDQMTAAQQNALRATVRASLLANSKLPDFPNMTPANQNRVIDKFLRDPQLKQELLTILNDIQGMPLTKETETIGAEKKTAISEVDRDEARRKRIYTQGDLREIENRLTQLIANPARANLGVQARLLFDQVRQYNREIGTLNTDLAALRGTLATIPATIMVPSGSGRGGFGMVAAPNPAYQAIQNDMTANTQRQAQIQAEISRLNLDRIDKVPTEESMEDKRDEKRQQLAEARREEVGTRFDERGNRVEHQELVEQRTLEEENITTRLEEAFQRSLARYVNKELQHSMELFEENEGKVQEESLKEIRRELARHLESRWTMRVARTRGIFRRRRDEPAINTAAVNRDFERLMQAGPNGGVEPLMRDALRRLRPTGPGNVRAALTPDQINDLMDRDNFTDEFRNEFLKNVIARRAIIRPFRQAEVYQMTTMPPVKAAIKDAMETNSDFRSFVDEMVGSEDAEKDPQGFWNRFSRVAWSQPGLFLFPVTTIPWSIWAGIRSTWLGTRTPRQLQRYELAA